MRSGVPVRDGRVGAVDDPDLGQGRRRPGLGRVVHEQPRQMRGAERGGPRRVGRPAGPASDRRCGCGAALPPAARGGVERLLHEAVGARPHRVLAVLGRPVEPHRGAEDAARHLERADERGEHRPRPAAFVAAPAVGHGLAEQHRHRPVRILRRRRWRWWRPPARAPGSRAARRRMVSRARRRPAPPIPGCRASRARSDARTPGAPARSRSARAVGADLDARRDVLALQRRASGTSGSSKGTGPLAAAIPDQGLPRLRVAEVVPARADEVGRAGHALEEGHVADARQSCSSRITWSSAKSTAASVFGRTGTHSVAPAPVTERCGSSCTHSSPRARASACRNTPVTPPRGVAVVAEGEHEVAARQVRAPR